MSSIIFTLPPDFVRLAVDPDRHVPDVDDCWLCFFTSCALPEPAGGCTLGLDFNSNRCICGPLMPPIEPPIEERSAVVRQIRTLRSVGAGGGRPPPATRCEDRNILT